MPKCAREHPRMSASTGRNGVLSRKGDFLPAWSSVRWNRKDAVSTNGRVPLLSRCGANPDCNPWMGSTLIFDRGQTSSRTNVCRDLPVRQRPSWCCVFCCSRSQHLRDLKIDQASLAEVSFDQKQDLIRILTCRQIQRKSQVRYNKIHRTRSSANLYKSRSLKIQKFLRTRRTSADFLTSQPTRQHHSAVHLATHPSASIRR